MSDTDPSRQDVPRRPISRTMSRSDNMPRGTDPSSEITTAPIRFSDNSFTASLTETVDPIVTTSPPPLEFKI